MNKTFTIQLYDTIKKCKKHLLWSSKIFNLLLFREEPSSPRGVIPRLKQAAEHRWGKWKGYVFVYVLNDLDNLSRRLDIDLV
jgi:hypothetical protein